MPSTSRPLLLQVFQIKWSSPIPDPLSEAQSVIYRRMDSHLEPSWAEEFSFGGVSLTKEEESVRVGSQKQKTGTKRRQSGGYVGEDNRRPRKASKTTCSLFAKKKLGSQRNLMPRTNRELCVSSTKGSKWSRQTRANKNNVVLPITSQADDVVTRTRRLWEHNLNQINLRDPLFFCTPDSKLSRKSRTWKEGDTYEGIRASMENCLALRKLNGIFYDPRRSLNEEYEKEFRRFCCTVSKFLRMCVARNICQKNAVWKMEVLFENSSNLDAVQRFIDFHLEWFSPRTVERRAQHFKKICVVALGVLKTRSDRTQIEQVSQYLDVIIKAKGLKKRSIAAELGTKASVPLRIMKHWFKLALSDLNVMMAKYKEETYERESSRFRYSFIEEWMPAFITYIVIAAGGQNPLTISKIEVPQGAEFEKVMEKAVTNEFVQLTTLRGRRTGILGLPLVRLPTFTIPILRFHINIVQPLSSTRTKREDSPRNPEMLLLDPNSGKPMDSWKVAYELKKFISKRSPGNPSASLRSLKLSALLMMHKEFRDEYILKGVSEDRFLDLLAQHQNTTSRQVKVWVGVRGSVEHNATAEELNRYLAGF
ncbi:hypothetical protein FGB62_195g018 [Gracilaria domingensis]|nr:hypothetical protein FGB62_195g018 [Gracilaria domingensis]